jgi:hypothetical protein
VPGRVVRCCQGGAEVALASSTACGSSTGPWADFICVGVDEEDDIPALRS